MKLPQDYFDEVLHRASLAALFYYPELAVDDNEYSLDGDVAYCLQPVSALRDEDLARLGEVVGRVITDPTAHRADLVELVIELAPSSE